MNLYEKKCVDLHVHSTKSDGSLSPSDLVLEAKKKGLKAFALTDHDTVDGIEEAMAASIGSGVTVIPGIELSTEYEGKDIHIVGLLIDKEQPAFKEKIQEFVDSRILRNRKMCQKLTEAGMPLTYEELMAEFPGAVITRAHYAQILLKKGKDYAGRWCETDSGCKRNSGVGASFIIRNGKRQASVISGAFKSCRLGSNRSGVLHEHSV